MKFAYKLKKWCLMVIKNSYYYCYYFRKLYFI